METYRICQLKKSFSLITCKLVIRKKIVNNYNFKKKSRLRYIGVIAYRRT